MTQIHRSANADGAPRRVELAGSLRPTETNAGWSCRSLRGTLLFLVTLDDDKIGNAGLVANLGRRLILG
jgi:hypothetical protein